MPVSAFGYVSRLFLRYLNRHRYGLRYPYHYPFLYYELSTLNYELTGPEGGAAKPRGKAAPPFIPGQLLT